MRNSLEQARAGPRGRLLQDCRRSGAPWEQMARGRWLRCRCRCRCLECCGSRSCFAGWGARAGFALRCACFVNSDGGDGDGNMATATIDGLLLALTLAGTLTSEARRGFPAAQGSIIMALIASAATLKPASARRRRSGATLTAQHMPRLTRHQLPKRSTSASAPPRRLRQPPPHHVTGSLASPTSAVGLDHCSSSGAAARRRPGRRENRPHSASCSSTRASHSAMHSCVPWP